VDQLRQFLSTFDFRSKANLGITLVAVTSQLTAVAAAAPVTPAAQKAPIAVCSRTADTTHPCTEGASGLQLALPDGAQQCPLSGEAAACATSAIADKVTPGSATTPDGQTVCPADPNVMTFSTPAACSDPSPNRGVPSTNPTVSPSIPSTSLQTAAAIQKLSLHASSRTSPADRNVTLTAIAGARIAGTGSAIEIFDKSTGSLVGACTSGSQCDVAYSAKSGVHNFVAYLTLPTTKLPTNAMLTSNQVSVGWIGLKVASLNPVVGPGKSVTVTATSSIPVEQFGYVLEMFDLSNMNRITYCSQGTNCTVSLTQAGAGTRSVVAAVGKPVNTFSNPDLWGVSDHFSMTWLSLAMGGSSTFQVGGTVHLSATANADITNTPWSIGIFDDQGRLVGKPCKTGSSCSADITVTSSSTPHFSAAIGTVPAPQAPTKLGQMLKKVTGPASLVDIQARSASVQPTRILWGVDSCKAFTGDPSGEVYSAVAGSLGPPDFWGRYLTSTVCPGLSWPEIYLAQRAHMGILPIYNDYDCSAVSGYNTGLGYAQEATSVAAHIAIPKGRVVAVDIEPPGAQCPGAAYVDSGFIRGWYDGVKQAGYVPVFYGNGTGNSEFAAAWCDAQSQVNQISRDSYIWSFEPSLVSGGWAKSNAPVWQPYATGCPDFVAAWQYQLGSNGPNADVDTDEVLSTLPLWYP
jgi:hypothetical protein